MNIYHKIIFTLKIIFLLLIFLVKTQIIPSDIPFQILVDGTFKIVLGLFVLYISFPWRKDFYQIYKEDYLLIFMTGVIFLLTINYKEYIQSYNDLFDNVKKKNILRSI